MTVTNKMKRNGLQAIVVETLSKNLTVLHSTL